MSLVEKMLSGVKSDTVDAAMSICRGYLNGRWKKITAGDISVRKLSGGLSNWLFLVRLEKGVAAPKQVLLRLYGQNHGENALEALVTESVVFTLLSERRLGPKLYGVFPGGRIEEFIPARPLKQHEMSDPRISSLVAQQMAAVHGMNVPIIKEPRWMWDNIFKWIATLDDVTIDESNSYAKNVVSKNLRLEALWLREHLSKINSPVVFCHNDLQQGNILMREDTDEPNIVFIDFEYCSYNYRAFDLANHFMEWTLDYTNPDYPNFSVNKSNYPTHSQMHAFLEQYLTGCREHGNKLKPDDTVYSLSREIKHYTLACHLFWCLWSAVNASVSRISFGYWEFAEERLNNYLQLKNEILTKQHGKKENLPVKRKMMDLD